MIRSCKTCDHRDGNFEFDYCLYSGEFCLVERKYPTVCGQNYENGWVQRRSWWKRLFGVNR